LILSHAVSAAFVAAALLASASAGAQDGAPLSKGECVGELDRAQSMQTTHKLREARTSYLSCAAPSCPALVREDCTRSLVEIERAMPTVVFSARADGRDVTDARVLLDGEAIASALDGHSVTLDPGSHVARFERTGGGVFEIKLVAREGEKSRPVSATFVSTTTVPEKPKAESGRFPVLPVILGGTGLLAIGGSFYLRLNANADADRLHNSCAPSCDQSSRDALSDKLVVANVALGVGIGAITLAAATWLFDPRH
jgi:hypothetical protein